MNSRDRAQMHLELAEVYEKYRVFDMAQAHHRLAAAMRSVALADEAAERAVEDWPRVEHTPQSVSASWTSPSSLAQAERDLVGSVPVSTDDPAP